MKKLIAAVLMGCGLLSVLPSVSHARQAPAPVITQDIIPANRSGRPLHRPMSPKYITIHDTDNTSPSADARHHAEFMISGDRARNTRTGYNTWHFTVDDHSIYQSLPTNETGEHADFEGPGNMQSIGIEMCVNRGSNQKVTIAKTAELTAWLMAKYHIPIGNVVPHMHWRRVPYQYVSISRAHNVYKSTPFKKCPAILLDNGQLGAKWAGFIAQVRAWRG